MMDRWLLLIGYGVIARFEGVSSGYKGCGRRADDAKGIKRRVTGMTEGPDERDEKGLKGRVELGWIE